MKQEYRIIKDLNSYCLKMVTYYDTFTAYGPSVVAKQTFEELRSEVREMFEAFGKELIDKDMGE